jgi:transposase-like protein
VRTSASSTKHFIWSWPSIWRDRRNDWACGLPKTKEPAFWFSVLTELQNRGVKDFFIGCRDGLNGLPEAIETVSPQTRVQLCMVHLMRNSLRYVSYKHMKAIATDLKAIYSASTEAEAEFNLELKALEMGRALSQQKPRPGEPTGFA